MNSSEGKYGRLSITLFCLLGLIWSLYILYNRHPLLFPIRFIIQYSTKTSLFAFKIKHGIYSLRLPGFLTISSDLYLIITKNGNYFIIFIHLIFLIDFTSFMFKEATNSNDFTMFSHIKRKFILVFNSRFFL